MTKKIQLLILLFSFSLFTVKAADRYWVAAGPSNWNNVLNWSTSSGGGGGASVPGINDVAIFNAGAVNCTVDIAVAIGGLSVNGYSGTIDLSGFTFTSSGTVTLATGTINDTPGTSSLAINSLGTSTFSGTTFGAIVNAASARLYLSGSVFNAAATFDKNGAGNDNGAGGNTFNGVTSITNSGTGRVQLSNTTADIFNAQLTLSSTGSNVLRLAHNGAATQLNGNVLINSTGSSQGIEIGQGSGSATLAAGNTITVGGIGFSVGAFEPRNFTQLGATAQAITLTGTATIDLEAGCVWNGNVNFSAPRVQIEQTTFNGTATLTKTGATNDNNAGGNTFNSTATIINNGSANFTFATTNPDTFTNDVTLITGGTGRIYLSNAAAGNVFNGNIFINYITNANIYIGNGSGTSTLAAGRTISIIGAGASGTGNLLLEEFTQLGATAQGIAMNGTGVLTIGPNSTFNGDLFTASPGIVVNQSTFNGVVSFDKTGTGGSSSYGGNVYNGVTTITNSGSNYLRLANTLGNTYNAQVTFSSTGSNRIEPARNGNSIFNENIIVNSTGTSTGIRFSPTASGSGTLAATKTVTIGGSGFSTGYLRFRNFNQLGGTAQSLTTTGTSRIYLDTNNTWNGNVNFSAPRMFLDGNTFNGTATIAKTGAGNDNGVGDNTFNDVVELTCTGTGYFGLANTGNDTYNENLIVNSTNTGGVRFGSGGGTSTIVATKTISIGGSGFTSGQLRLRGIIQVGPTAQNITLTGTAILNNFDSSWDGDVTFVAPRNFTRGTTYNGTAYIEKTDATDDASVGGNIFNSTVQFVNSGSGYLMMGNGTFDTYASDVTITNSGTYRTYFANSGLGHLVSGNLTVNNTATGSDNYVYLANNAAAGLTVTGNTIINNSGTGTNNRVYVGNNGSITFNGTVDLNNIGSGGNSEIYCNHAAAGSNTYNENITLTSTNGSGIRFGEGGGAAILADTKTITVDGGGFTTGELRFRNFTQTGATPQSITLTGSAILRFREDNVFNANFTSVSPRLLLEGGTFNGTTLFTKNGNTNDDSRGGSVFNGATTITNTSTRRMRLNNNVAYSDDFNNNVTFVRSGTGAISVARVGTTTFASNVNVNGSSAIVFGAGGGVAEFDGGAAQSINDALGTSATPDFYNLRMNNTVDELTLNMPITVVTSLELNNGNIITTNTNLLSMSNGSGVTAVSNDSYVAGPIEKIGVDPFTFPVGNGGFYAAISIAAPSVATDAFRAEYFAIGPLAIPTDTSAHDASINHVSRMESWDLNRITGTSNVAVTLSWDSIRSGKVTNLSELLVSRWDGSSWRDEGNSLTTGNTTTGTVVSFNPVSSFNPSTPFTIGTTTNNNTLPIKLVNFEAKSNDKTVALEWVTAVEINNDFFTIQRSKDGYEWEDVLKKKGAGNSNSYITYNDNDDSPIKGISYYRLKQTDFNGDFSYSEAVTVRVNLKEINVYPNPVINNMNIANLCESCIVNVYSSNGQLVYSGNGNLLNTSNWTQGLYEVVINNNDGIMHNSRIIKR